MSSHTVLFIRHGKDTPDEHKYDERLSNSGKEDIRVLTEKLIEEHGIPEIIYYSPFHRTRQTTKIILKEIKSNHNIKVKSVCDWRLSRYFTERQRKNPDIRKDTRSKGAPLNETWSEFKKRALKQLEDMESSEEKVIWCITHTLVLSCIIKKKNIDHPYNIPYLDTIVIN